MTLPAIYRDAAPQYRAAGWAGVLPLPAGRKGPPPGSAATISWTGHGGCWPSGADIQAWIDGPEGDGNIGLRLPPDVIGIDVDDYDGKRGGQVFTAALARWGALPPTWTSTARAGVSGIRLYRVPDGLRWPGQVGEHVEIIQVGHRYLVVAPSRNPDAGGAPYRWIRPDGVESVTPPAPDDLPALPDPWVRGLTNGERAEDVTLAALATAQVQAWIVAHHRGVMCGAMRTTLAKLLDELRTGSAHEALRRMFGLARLAEQGHAGLAEALTATRGAFHAEVTRPGRRGTSRSPDDAEQEFRRSLAGAVRRVVGSPSVGPDETPPDPCADPFAGLVDAAYLPPPAARLADPPAPAVHLPAGQPAPGPAGADHPGGVFAAEGDTWRPRDLRAALHGQRARPTLLRFGPGDGRALFYPGKINGLLGESESGKSWLALHAVAQEITAGHAVVYVDFEDTDVTLAHRLLALGCDEDTIVDQVAYLSPEEPLTGPAAEVLDAVIATRGPTLVILDGVNAAMARLGLDSNSTTDATRFAQALLARLVVGGAAVVTIDHVGKNKETRGKGGIGSQAKRAMTSGALIACEIVTPLGAGKSGKIRLVVDKDRHGGVEYQGQNRYVGTARVLSVTNPDRVRIEIDPPDERSYDERVQEPNTGLMMRISAHLARNPGGMSKAQLEKEIGGNRDRVRVAVQALVEAKCVEARQRDGRGGGALLCHVAHYRPDPDDLVDQDGDD